MNILLTSAGRRGYLIRYFQKALEGKGKVFATNSHYTPTLGYADSYAISPLIYDSSYIDFLLDYSIKNQISAIIPLFDIDAGILASNKARFDAVQIPVITGTSKSLAVCNDKWEMYRYFTAHDIPTPQTFLTADSCKQAIKRGELTYPVIVKPRWGMGSIGIYIADDEAELEIFCRKLKRDIFKTYLKYESAQDREHCVIFQEKISGQEFGLDVINDLQGNYVITSVKRKLAMRAGETDIAVTVALPQLEDIGRRLSELMCHLGNLDVDCFMVNGNPYVLEMNCRFGGQFPFSYLAGVDLPRQIICWLAGEQTNLALLTPQSGVLSSKELLPVKDKFTFPAGPAGIEFSINQATVETLENFYRQSSDYFRPPLCERISDLHALAEKNRSFGFSMEAWQGKNLIGLVVGYANDHICKRSYLPFVIVKNEMRKRGIARFLIQNAISFARMNGMDCLELHTDRTNLAALRLYNNCGFQEVSRIDNRVHLRLEL